VNTVESLAKPMVAALIEGVHELLEWSVQHPGCSASELLARSAELGQRVERACFSAAVEAAGRYEPAPECPACGRTMHRHDRPSRVVVTRRGERAARFQRFRCPQCGELVTPRWAAWGVRQGCSPDLQQVAALLATGAAYRTVELALKQLGIPLSDSSLQRLVTGLGTQLAEAQAAAAAAAQQDLMPEVMATPQRLYLLHDGVKARVAGQWRTVRLGVTYETAAAPMDDDGQVPAPERVRCQAWLADSDTFCERFLPSAVAAGLWRAREVVLLMDGEEGMWERLPHLPLASTPQVQILDFYHAAENLGKATRAVCGEGTPAAKAWFERLRQSLRAGDLRSVRDGLRTLQSRADGEALRVVTNALGYLHRHRERLDYQRLHWAGYHIGSGQVESRCKQVGQRLKRSGANWSRAGLRAMLALQCHYLSHPQEPLPLTLLAA